MKEKNTFWQEGVSIETFKTWCHKPQYYKSFIVEWLTSEDRGIKNVLDVGCGTAHIGELLKKNNSNIEYVGIEITEKFVEHNIEAGFECYVGNINEMSFGNNSFDVVLGVDIMNHMANFEKTFDELYRVSDKYLILTFFKDWETPGRIVEMDGYLYHHFCLNQVEEILNSHDCNYRKISWPSYKVDPKIIIVKKEKI